MQLETIKVTPGISKCWICWSKAAAIRKSLDS